MSAKDHIYNISGIIAGVVVVALIIGALAFGLDYFNSAKKDIMANDIQIEILKEGSGVGAKIGDTVAVHYKGTLTDGQEFDNSYKRGEPFPVTIGEGQVIAGWEKGLQGIKVGEKRKLVIPPAMAYGEQAIPDGKGGYIIPANSTLIFEIEAIEIDVSA